MGTALHISNLLVPAPTARELAVLVSAEYKKVGKDAASNISFKSSPSSKPIAPSSTAPAMPPEPIKGWSKINQPAHTI